MRELPRQLGPYRLVRRLGAGGMAEVFLAVAFGASGFEKRVVLKVLRPEHVGDAVYERMFIEEGRLGARLSHRNLVGVHDLGYAEGTYYVRLDYVDGGDLATLLARGRPGTPLSLYLADELALALGAVHGLTDDEGRPLGVVHRDVTPANVLVSRQGEVKLADFGIAKATLLRDTTRAGVRKGTYAYMSPEQVRGGALSPASDFFSLGTTLHELLTGRRPFDGETPLQCPRRLRGPRRRCWKRARARTRFRAHMSTETTGFWGPRTATVDWCETNYEHVHYISELFNSVSSLAMVLVGVLGIVLHRQVLERRFFVAFALVSVVGLGSIAFHTTLRFEHQMMDELPMLYLVSVMAFILLENHPERRFGVWLPLALFGYAVLSTALAAGTRGKLQFYLFQVSFMTLELFALVRTYLIHRRSKDGVGRRIFRFGMGSYVLALTVWISDNKFCSTLNGTLPSMGIPNPQLHAWWHVLVSIGFYMLLLVIAHDRLKTLGKAPEVRFVAGVIPIVRGTAA